jgi:hypothetical protein
MRRGLPYVILLAGVGVVACGSAFTQDPGDDNNDGGSTSTEAGGDDGAGDEPGMLVTPEAGSVDAPDTVDASEGGDEATREDAADEDTVTDMDVVVPPMDATTPIDASIPDTSTPIDVYVPPPTDACTSEVADETTGYFVTPGGAASSCGSRSVPCGSVQTAITLAHQYGKPYVYVNTGTYTEQLTLGSNVTVQGGWIDQGGLWSRDCGGGNAADVQIVAPSTTNTTVVASGVSGAVLDTLSIASKAESAVGTSESIYGVMATNGAALTLQNVSIAVVGAGVGSVGSTGTPGTGSVACTTPGDMATGGTGSPGSAGVSGSYAAAGYSDGVAAGTGGTASPGDNGAAGGAPLTATCIGCFPEACPPGDPSCGHLCTVSMSSVTGTSSGSPGCGGNGGGGGSGGSGGGSSIAVYAWNSVVAITAGSLEAGAGGQGGPGGAGAMGAVGSTGQMGTGSCTNNVCHPTTGCAAGTITPLGGSAGGQGGTGGTGGVGGGGAGGDSYAWYAGGGASVTTDGATTLMNGSGGTGGAGGNTGPNGTAAAHN